LKRLLRFVVISVWTSLAFSARAQDETLKHRSFQVSKDALEQQVQTFLENPAATVDEFVEISDTSLEEQEKDQERLVAFFETAGVTFPAGSSIRYSASLRTLIVRNTQENHKAVALALRKTNILPAQIRLDVAVIAFPKSEIVKIARANDGAFVDPDKIKALWKSGTGEILTAERVVTRTGLEADIKSGEQVIVPEEFALQRIQVMDSETNLFEKAYGLEPQVFGARHTGMNVKVTPHLQPDGQSVALVLNPEYCTGPKPQDFGFTYTDEKGKARRVKLDLPIFYSRNATTSFSALDGETIVIGGTDPENPGSATFMFITPSILTPDGLLRSDSEVDVTAAKRKADELGLTEEDETEAGMETCAFSVQAVTFEGTIYARRTKKRIPEGEEILAEDNLRRFFENEFGEFPVDASVRYEPSTHTLEVTNDPEYLDQVNRLLKRMGPFPQVEIDSTIVAFPSRELEKLARKTLSASPKPTDLKALWRAGKGKLTGYYKLVTQSGKTAVWKSVAEISYPSEFQRPNISGSIPAEMTPPPFFGFSPGSFETRDVGMLSELSPLVEPDGYTISLTMDQFFIPSLDWKDFGFTYSDRLAEERHIPIKLPIFDNRTVTTSVVINNGATLVMAAGMSQGKQPLFYVLVTARLLIGTGRRVAIFQFK